MRDSALTGPYHPTANLLDRNVRPTRAVQMPTLKCPTHTGCAISGCPFPTLYSSDSWLSWFGSVAVQQLQHAVEVLKIAVLDNDPSLAFVICDSNASA